MGAIQPDVEAKLIAMVRSGYRASQAARELGMAQSTAYKIMHRIEDSGAEIIPKHDQAIAEIAGEIQIDMLEWMIDQPPELQWKNAFSINAMRGTPIDKIIERSKGSQPSQDKPPFVIVIERAIINQNA